MIGYRYRKFRAHGETLWELVGHDDVGRLWTNFPTRSALIAALRERYDDGRDPYGVRRFATGEGYHLVAHSRREARERRYAEQRHVTAWRKSIGLPAR